MTIKITLAPRARAVFNGDIMATEVLGNGIYTFGEASRLIGVRPQRLRAWFSGLPNRVRPITQSDYSLAGVISFWDLVDAMVIGQLRGIGFPLDYLRKLRVALLKEFQSPHPFCQKNLLTYGKKVFIRTATDSGDDHLKDIVARQYAFPQILAPFLQQLEHDPASLLARRWNIANGVVIDPRRQYGKPIVDLVGIPTAVLQAECRANEGRIERVAEWYAIDKNSVKQAVEFEEALARKVA